MQQPWKPERELTLDQAHSLISAQFADLKQFTISELGRGWDQSAFSIGDWVFRFPRRALGAQLLEREIRLMPWLAPRLPIAVPEIDRVGAPSSEWPWPFAGHRLVRGRAVSELELDDEARARLLQPLADFLRALHAIAPPDWLPLDELGRLDLATRTPKVRARLDELLQAGALDRDRARRLSLLLDRVKRVQNRPLVLLHGDLYSRHVLLDDRQSLSGVIDWGDAHRGDRACDLAAAIMLLPPALHDRFRAAYGGVDEDTWELARYRTVSHATAVLAYAFAEGDRTMLAEARRALAHVEDAR